MTTLQREIDRPATLGGLRVGAMVRILTWPVLSLLITGGFHFTSEAIWPDLRTFFTPPVLAPILLAYGAWAGYRSVATGGNLATAIVAGAILGVLPVALETVGFGLILGRGLTAGTLAAVFGFSMILFGSLVGAGFVLSGDRPTTTSRH